MQDMRNYFVSMGKKKKGTSSKSGAVVSSGLANGAINSSQKDCSNSLNRSEYDVAESESTTSPADDIAAINDNDTALIDVSGALEVPTVEMEYLPCVGMHFSDFNVCPS